jgi:hypothetical protein
VVGLWALRSMGVSRPWRWRTPAPRSAKAATDKGASNCGVAAIKTEHRIHPSTVRPWHLPLDPSLKPRSRSITASGADGRDVFCYFDATTI